MPPTLRTILAAYPIWLPVLVVLLASLATRLTAYPRAAGVVTGIRVLLDVLSIWQHRDSPGTGWQLPIVQRSNPPEDVKPAPLPEVPPAGWLVLLCSCLLGCEARDVGREVLLALGLVLVAAGLVRWYRGMAARVFRLLAVLLLASAPGCGATTKQIAATATIATVQTLDEGIAQFTAWASSEEDGIAEAAVRGCTGKATRADYNSCTSAITAPRRAPIDRAKAAIRLYRAALAGGDKLAQGDLALTSQSVIEALAAVGIKIAAGGVL